MGDRAVIAIKQSNFDGSTLGYLHVYTHWTGREWAEAGIKAALEARPRWGDEAYATRIMLTELIGKVEGPTGYGVSLSTLETEYPVPVFDLEHNRAWWVSIDAYEDGNLEPVDDELVSIDEFNVGATARSR